MHVCVCVEIVDRKLVEMMGRVNLGLNVKMVGHHRRPHLLYGEVQMSHYYVHIM